MEFFFLIERVWPEIVVLILLIVILIVLFGHRTYTAIKDIKSVFEKKPRKTHATKASESVSELSKGGTDTSIKPIEMSTTDEDKTSPSEDAPKQKEEKNSLEPTHILDTGETEKVLSLVAGARTLIARGMFPEARGLIVEGLSIDKDHRELNLLLAQIYEQEGSYEKAEYIYKDLAHAHPSDGEILERLGNVLIIEKKYTIALEIYKKILSLSGESESTLYMLTHISSSLGNDEDTLKYAKKYNLQWPKNPEILSILGNVQLTLGKRKDAIETFKLLKNISPYNSEIAEILQKLMVEEELAGNFTPQS